MNDNYRTPEYLYDKLNQEFHFNDDPCPYSEGIPLIDGLKREWGTITFMNPPYSNPYPWCKKAFEESLRGKLIVGLLRVDTSTKWFHEFCYNKAELRFLKGRIKFNGKTPNFASMICVWHPPLINSLP